MPAIRIRLPEHMQTRSSPPVDSDDTDDIRLTPINNRWCCADIITVRPRSAYNKNSHSREYSWI